MIAIDLHLSQDQFASLAQFGKDENILSPFNTISPDKKKGRITHPEVVLPDGSVRPDFQAVLDVLDKPAKTVSLTFINQAQMMDMALFFAENASAEQSVSISNDNGEMRLQSPAPLQESMNVARAMLGPSPSEYLALEASLDLTAAWMFWALLDRYRKQESPVKLEEFSALINEPYQGLSSLAAYFRETLDLISPSKSEIKTAVFRLVLLGMITPSEKGYLPADEFTLLAKDLATVRSHMSIKINGLASSGGTETARYWALQGASGTLLLWYECEGTVEIRTLTPGVIMEMVRGLAVPVQAAPVSAPPPPMQSVTAMPPMVERYQPPRQKSGFGKIALSILFGLAGLGIALVAAGFIVFPPGKGVAFIPSPNATESVSAPAVEEAAPDAPAPVETKEAVIVSAKDLNVDLVNSVVLNEGQNMIVGRVTNKGMYPVSSFSIALELKDSNENFLGEGWASPFASELAPGEETYFNYYYDDLSAKVEYVTTTISDVYPGFSGSSTKFASYEKEALHNSQEGVDLIGEVVNQTDQPMEISSIYGVLFDTDNQIVGAMNAYYYLGILRPGENMPVKVSFQMSEEERASIDRYQLYAEMYPVDEVVDSPISISRQNNLFRADGRVLIAGEVMNSGASPEQFSGLACALYDDQGNLLDVSFTNINIPLPAGSTAPYLLYGWDYLSQEENQGIMPATYLILATESSSYPVEKEIRGMDVEITKRGQSGMWYEVSGTVTNNNAEALDYGTVIIGLRDPQSGTIMNAETTWVSELQPGSTQEFTVYMVFPLEVDPDAFDLETTAYATVQ